MRLRSRLLIPLVICLVAAIPSIPVQANCDGPAILLVPGSGVPGTQLIIQGVRFEAGQYIDIYYDGDIVSEGTKVSAGGDFSIPFTIPESCKGDHPILVEAGIARLQTSFYATQGLMVIPDKGAEGTTVTVTGHGFFKNEDAIELMYYTDEDTYDTVGKDIEANADGYWETTFEVPTSGRGEHKLDARGHFSQTYNVRDASFAVTAGITIDKSSGMVGDSMTMSGTRFGAYEKDIRILFNGQPVITGIKADGGGNWEKTFDLPELATGNYTVTVDGQYTAQQDIVPLSFEIAPDIVLSAYVGYVGMNVTVTGYGFIANTDVSIMYDGDQQARAPTDGQGNFEGSFIVPQSLHGDHEITIGYSATSTAAATFTVEADPPGIAQLISPSDGARVGLKSDVTPTFEWSEVSDDSGVSYNFQLSTSPDVTSTGEFAQPMIAASNLIGTSYTVTQTLAKGTYYWIVQAVDGAQNQGSWTTARVFRVGVLGLPLWAFIAIIVGAVVLTVLLVRALVRRRRYADWW